MFNMFSFINDIANYEDRKLARDKINGLVVSTAYTSDEGYETAILDSNGTYPVERYETKEEAILGHNNWCEKAKTVKTITMLGGMGGLCDEKIVVLNRNEN